MEDGEDDDRSWLGLQDLMDSSWFLNMDTTRTSFRKMIKEIYPQRGIFRSKDEEEKMMRIIIQALT